LAHEKRLSWAEKRPKRPGSVLALHLLRPDKQLKIKIVIMM
jgi:hypothetical protein